MYIALSPQDFKKELNTWNWVLLDIRTGHEQMLFWVISEKQLHIDIYLSDAFQQIASLDKGKTYLIYCWHGNRSKQIGEYMSEKWFKKVYDLAWGIEEWNKII